VPKKGYKQTQEHRDKIADAKRGKTHSEETRAKQGAATAERHERKRVRKTFFQKVREHLEHVEQVSTEAHAAGYDVTVLPDKQPRLVMKSADGSVVPFDIAPGFLPPVAEERVPELVELEDVMHAEIRKQATERRSR
jgi:hypothetical protein